MRQTMRYDLPIVARVSMTKTFNVRIPSEDKENLDLIACLHDCYTNESPSIPKLISAIAKRQLALVSYQNIDKGCANGVNLNHQNFTDVDDSFRSRLIIAIAQGMSANAMAIDYPASVFADKVFERVEAIMGDGQDESAFHEDFL